MPDFIGTFRNSNHDVAALVATSLANIKWLEPRIKETGVIEDSCIEYIPLYIYNVRYQASWSGSVGYYRRTVHTEYRTTTHYHNGHRHTRREPHATTHIETDWHPVNGLSEGSVRVAVFAGPASPQFLNLYETSADNLGESGEIGLLPGLIMKFQDTPEAFWDQRGRGVAYLKVDQRVRRENERGDVQRDWKCDSKLQLLKSSTALVPFGKATLVCGNERYDFLIDLGNPNRYWSSPLPTLNRFQQIKHILEILSVKTKELGWPIGPLYTQISKLVGVTARAPFKFRDFLRFRRPSRLVLMLGGIAVVICVIAIGVGLKYIF